MDLVLNNLQRLICHKTQQNQTKPNHSKGIDIALVADNVASRSYMEGDAVWVKNTYGKMHDVVQRGHGNENQPPTLYLG